MQEDPDEPIIDFTEDIEKSWRKWLTEFKTDVYPMFEEYGISMDSAIVCWHINKLNNAVDKGPSF